MKVILGVVGAVVVAVVLFLGYQYWRLSQAAVKWDSAQEIASEKMENENNVWKIEFQSVIDKPIADVWQAVQQPERSSEFIDNFKKSELKSHEGNKKVIEMQIQVLTLPLQTAVMQFAFDEANKRVELTTLKSQVQDLNATYELRPSPDGTKTLFTYRATAKSKISVPLPVSAQKGAFKELFVKTVQAIKKGIEQEAARRKAAA